VVIVDTVTTRRADLHAELLTQLGVESTGGAAGPLWAASYRPVGGDGDGQLQVWPEALEVGERLPTLPLWLGPEPAVPLDLEASHAAACADLRIREAG
jgi:hypothetical protein